MSNAKGPMIVELAKLAEKESANLAALRKKIKEFSEVYIAYSGGVDSSLVAAIAYEQLGKKAIAVTGISPALAPNLLEEAREQAKWIGIRHIECYTQELQNPFYRNNPKDRCYACKEELHKHLKEISKAAKGAQIIDGINFDDLDDYRPGIKAAKDAGVRSPLAELRIDKNSVRKISKVLGFPWWDKPAQPCLASRFPYGEQINAEKLSKVAKVENWLRINGFKEVRVRSQGKTARIEVPEEEIERLIININRKNIVKYFLSVGYTSVCLDLEGLISGKLNRN